MKLSGLVASVAQGYPLAKVQAQINQARLELVAPLGAHAAITAVIASLRQDAKLNTVHLVVASTGREAEELALTLASFDPTAEVLEFPSWETLPHERLSPSPETVGKRLKTIHRLHELAQSGANQNVYVIASVRAVLQPVVAGLDQHPPFVLKQGSDYFLPELSLKLVEMAYGRVDLVTKRGEFAIRGGIVDIFPTTAEHAVRLEFFGDELEQIRQFGVADQRSMGELLESVQIYAAREVIITPLVASRAREMVHEFPNLSTMLEKISQGIPVDGMESLAPVLTEKMVAITDYLPAQAAVILLSPEKSAARAASLIETNEEFLHAAWDAAIEGAKAPIDLSAGGFISLGQLSETLAGRQLITVSQFASDDESVVNLEILEVPNFKGLDLGVTDWIADQSSRGELVVIATEGHGTAERIAEVLAVAGVTARVVESIGEKTEPKTVYLTQASLRKGFVAPASHLIVLTEAEFYQKHNNYVSPRERKLATKRGQTVDPLSLKSGDYVVHEIHGIGRFVELVERTSGVGTAKHQREYLLIEYAPSKRNMPGDTLFVPTDQLDFLTRYVGGEAPVLSKLGGSDWAAAKGRARKAIRKIAIDLVKLYSARVKSKGYAFGPDTPWQHELEEAFAYVETPDQLST
ncbi:MAG: CarD family transcriptional regulator, partial [Actinomycetes bacterium]